MTQDPLEMEREARRERRVERRRLEILDAAALVFAAKGYESTTTRDIATAVDLGESTLYNYFSSKWEILLAIAELKRREVDEFLGGIGPIEDRAGLVQVLDRALALWLSRVHFSRTVILEAMHNPEFFSLVKDRVSRISGLLRDYLERHMQSGQFRRVDADLTARMILGMFFSLHLPFLYGTQPPPTAEQRQQYAETMAGLLLDGLAQHPLPEGNQP